MSCLPGSGRRHTLVRTASLTPKACAGIALIFAIAALSACSQQAGTEAPAPPAPTPPMAQDTPPPDYPPELACKQVGGTAILDVAIAANGYPVKIDIVTSSGNKMLDDSAIAAVHDWKFRPATVRGKPAPIKIQVPVSFNPPNPPPDECNQYL